MNTPITIREKTFHQRLLDREHSNHTRRVCELQRAEKALLAIEPLVRVLEARGVTLSLDNTYVGVDRIISLSSGRAFETGEIYDSAIAYGCKEIRRTGCSSSDLVYLKCGRYTISLWTPSGHGITTMQTATQVTA
jgi:hypothetical protein